MNYGMVTIPLSFLHEPQTTSTINYNVQFGYYATWDYNKFINRGGNGDSDVAGIEWTKLYDINGDSRDEDAT